MTLVELIAVVAATWQIVEIWHHSEIMATYRARFENWELSENHLKHRIGQLVACPYCASVWVGWIVLGLLLVGRLHWLLDGAVAVFLYGLAASRLANLGNDLTRTWCRTPKPGKLDTRDERYDASGVLLPYGRCDACGLPDGPDHECPKALLKSEDDDDEPTDRVRDDSREHLSQSADVRRESGVDDQGVDPAADGGDARAS